MKKGLSYGDFRQKVWAKAQGDTPQDKFRWVGAEWRKYQGKMGGSSASNKALARGKAAPAPKKKSKAGQRGAAKKHRNWIPKPLPEEDVRGAGMEDEDIDVPSNYNPKAKSRRKYVMAVTEKGPVAERRAVNRKRAKETKMMAKGRKTMLGANGKGRPPAYLSGEEEERGQSDHSDEEDDDDEEDSADSGYSSGSDADSESEAESQQPGRMPDSIWSRLAGGMRPQNWMY